MKCRMSALGQKQTCAAHSRCPLSANSGHGDVRRAFENALSAGDFLVTRPHYLSGATVVFEEPSGAGCIPGGDWPCGLSGGAPPVPVSIGPDADWFSWLAAFKDGEVTIKQIGRIEARMRVKPGVGLRRNFDMHNDCCPARRIFLGLFA